MNNMIKENIVKEATKINRPRLHMSVILSFCAIIIFLSSRYLLDLDITLMAVRFPLSIFIGYIVFLFCLFIWTKYHYFNISHINFENGIDIKEIKQNALSKKVGIGDMFELVIEGNELLPFWILLITTLFLLIAVYFLVYNAPLLMTELVFDSAIVAGLYKKMGEIQARAWLRNALSFSLPYFIFVLIMSSISGFILQTLFPWALTLGDLLRRIL